MLEQSIMIDIETLGVRPGCAILSIGACEFGPKGIGNEFYVSISPNSCTEWGLTIEPFTVLWWMDQSQDARDFITKGKHVELDQALDQLRAAFNWKSKKVWCNGATFDFPILTAAHNAIGKSVPWEFWNCHDYRTIKNIVGRDVHEACKVEPSVAHNALADAVAQAQTLINMSKHIEITKPMKEKKRAS